ncbi:MAG: hypothetical protein MUP70_00945 [Candidatus Aminicenantes bacterium]|nr:hypothetical protein [Candidatus Aminicenantes bacterium]
MFSGSYSVRFDTSGRIKIPEKFRADLEESFGKDIFITSLTNEAVQIYPWPVWEKLTGITTQGLLHLKPNLRRFKLQVNRKGSHHIIDSKGRILISQDLREKAQLEELVEVVGLDDHFEVWNKTMLDRMLDENPLTDSDFETIANLAEKDE